MKKVILIYILLQLTYSVTNAQIKLMDFISPNSTAAKYPTHLDTLGKGGYMVVNDTLSRNNIPNERRKYGMLVFVQNGNKFFKLNTPTILTGDVKDNSSWLELGLSSASDVTGQLALKLNLADTANMLSSRFERDTASLSNRINLKLNISDTSDMLSQRIARDTASLSNRINFLEQASGGALADSIDNIRLKIKQDSIAITTKIRLDSTTISSSLVSKESVLSNRINLKVSISDTADMLSNRFARDTVSLSDRINRLAGATDGALGDSIALVRSKIKSDSTLIGTALKDSANNLNARINFKLNIADTADMLTNRIKRDTSFLVQKSDTAAWLNSRFARDTASLSERITNLQSATFDSTVIKVIPGYLRIRDTTGLLQKADTSDMLSNRFARDTASLSRRIDILGSATDGALSDSVTFIRNKIQNDSIVLANKIRSDSTVINTSLVDSSNALNGRINLKLNISDTASMLTSRFARDTASLSARINLLRSSAGGALGDSMAVIRAKIYTDSTVIHTALVDSSNTLNGRINLKLNISDTALMLSNRFARDTASLSRRISSLGASAGGALTDSITDLRAKILLDSIAITTKLRSDSTTIASLLVTKETALSNRINLKLNISDTANMLSNRFERDTASLSNRIIALGSSSSTALIDSINSIRDKILRDSNASMSNLKDTASAIRLKIRTDSTDLTTKLKAKILIDSNALVSKIRLDSIDLTTKLKAKILIDSNAIAVKLRADSAKLSSQIIDSSNNISSRLNTLIADTANMLNTRFQRDTASLSNRINTLTLGTSAALSDSIDVIRDKLRRDSAVTAQKFRTDSIAIYQKILLDSNNITTKLRSDSTIINRSLVDSANALNTRINLRLKISDTSTMVSNLLRKTDTATMMSNSMRISDTSTMLTNRIKRDTSFLLQKADTITLSNRINSLGLSVGNALVDSVTDLRDKISSDSTTLNRSLIDSASALTDRINLKLNISDTSTMLSNRLKISDTSTMLTSRIKRDTSFLLQKADTITLSNRIDALRSSAGNALGDSITDLRAKIFSDSTDITAKLRLDSTTINRSLIDSAAAITGRINLKVNIADTSTMLSNRLKISDTSTMLTNRIKRDTSFLLQKADTITLSRRIDALNAASGNAFSDLSNMIGTEALATLAKLKSDSTTITSKLRSDSTTINRSLIDSAAALTGRINLKVNISDTSTMLSNRLKISDTATMMSNSMRISDTSTMVSNLLRKTDTTQMLSNRLKISDTSTMLTNRIKRDTSFLLQKADTITLSNRINALKSSAGNALGDSVTDLRAKIFSDSTDITAKLRLDSTTINRSLIDSAAAITGRINLKVNIADTSTMLSNRLKISDTSTMLTNRIKRDTSFLLQKADTITLSNRIDALRSNAGSALGDSITIIRDKLGADSNDIRAKILLDSTNITAKMRLDSTTINRSLIDSAAALTGRINLKVNIADTSTMLSNRLKISDTSTMVSNLLRKTDTATMLSNRLKISDTSTMVSNLLRKTDTATMMSNSMRISDTSTMLTNRIKRDTSFLLQKADTITLSNRINALRSSAGSALGDSVTDLRAKIFSDSTDITAKLRLDSTTINRSLIDSAATLTGRINLKVNIADTSTMLNNRLKISDTTTMVSNLLRKTDTATMMSNSLRISDTSNMVSNLLRKTDTATMMSNSMRISDTSTMLSNRLKITDTTTMVSNLLRKTDTATMMSNSMRISDTSTMLTNRIKRDTSFLLQKVDTSFLLKKSDTSFLFQKKDKEVFSNLIINTINNGTTKLNAIDTADMLTNRFRRDTSLYLLLKKDTSLLFQKTDTSFLFKKSDTSFLLQKTDTSFLLKKTDTSFLLAKIDTSKMLSNRLKISDTSTMLSNLLRKTDTSTMVSNLLRKTDTATMLSNRLRITDTSTMLSNRLRITDTATMLSNRLRITDTSTMLSNRLRITDTSTMLSNRLRITDTATMLSRRITKDTASLSSRIDLRVREVADEFNYGTVYTPAITITVTNVSGTNYNYIGFPLTQRPHTSSKVKMFINGIRVSNSCYTLLNNIITYKPDLNSGYNLIASDRIQFDYYY